MSDRLLDLQHAIKAFLDAREFFSNSTADPGPPIPIPVVTEDNQDPTSQVEQALAMASGICVLIRTPGGKIPSGDHAVPVYDPALVHLRVYENTEVNRGPMGTLQPACKVADAAIRMLYGQTIPGFNAPLIPKSRAFGTEQEVPFYDIIFETVVPLDGSEPSRTESPIEPLVTESGVNIIAE